MVIERYKSLKVFHLDNGGLELCADPNMDIEEFIKTAIPEAKSYVRKQDLEGVSLYGPFEIEVYVGKNMPVDEIVDIYEEILFRSTGLTIS